MLMTVKILFCNQLRAQNYENLLNYVVTSFSGGKVIIFFNKKNKKQMCKTLKKNNLKIKSKHSHKKKIHSDFIQKIFLDFLI